MLDIIYGNTVGTTTPRPDWNQTNPKKADFIKNKPEIYTKTEIDEINAKHDGEGEFSEIFNDYENSSALGDYSHVEGEKTSGFSRNAHAEGGQVKSGGRGFKIIDCANEGNGNGYYIINTTELGGLVVGDRYSVRMVSAKYDVGAITNIEALTDGTTKLTVNNYPNIALEAEDANDPASYTVENYLTIVGKPHLGNVDVGFNAHAEGEKTIAQDRDAHAEGRGAKAIGQYAHAEGRDTTAAYAAHAEGRGTKAMGDMSHAEGQNTKALGERTHAEGATTEAIGNNSHAEGQNTKAIGHTSHAEGWGSMAEADVTHAEGIETKAYGYGSHSEGLNTIANGDYQHVGGKWNAPDNSSLFIIGNGTSEDDRRNAMTLDRNGDLTVSGKLTPTDYSNFDEKYLKNIGNIGDVMNYCGELSDVSELPETADNGDIYIVNKESLINVVAYTGKIKDLFHCETEQQIGMSITGNPDTLYLCWVTIDNLPEGYLFNDTKGIVNSSSNVWCDVYDSTTRQHIGLMTVNGNNGYPRVFNVEDTFGTTSLEEEVSICFGLRIDPTNTDNTSKFGFVDKIETKTLKSTYCWTEGSWSLINNAIYDEFNKTIEDINNKLKNRVEYGGNVWRRSGNETIGTFYTDCDVDTIDNTIISSVPIFGRFDEYFKYYYTDEDGNSQYTIKLSDTDYPYYFVDHHTYVYNADNGEYVGEFYYNTPRGCSVDGLCGYKGNDDDIVYFIITNAGPDVEFYVSPPTNVYFAKDGALLLLNGGGDNLELMGGGLPAVTTSDNGKVLSVVGGLWAAEEITTENVKHNGSILKDAIDAALTSTLPEVTINDNGKFLRVVEGEWTADEIEIGEGGSVTVSQEFGDSKTKTMSQDVITNTFESLGNVVCGKNLFDFSKGQAGVRFDDNGNITSSGASATSGITDYIPVRSGDAIVISCNGEDGTRVNLTARRVLGYDKDKNFLGLLRTYAYGFSFYTEDLAYIRIQFSDNFTEESEIQIEINGLKTEYKPYEQVLIPNNEDPFKVSSNIRMPINKTTSDLTIIGDRVCIFMTSSDVGVMDGAIYTARINEIDKTIPTLNARIYHDFGHCNTIDYNEKTDCLILGNGSGEYGVDGKFYVIPEAHKILERQQNTLADIAIEYDCTAYNFGDKVNMCWGYDNNGKHDIAIMITDDNKNIRFVQLGKGANALEYGSLIAGKTDNEFNGTFRVQAEYTIDDGTRFGDSTSCNQGSCYRDGILYVSVGHEPHRHWEIAFRPDGKASYTEVYEPIYGDDGIAVTGATEGMTVTDNYIITSEVTKYSEDNNVRNLVFRKRNQSQILSMSIIDSKDIKHENETLLNIINELQNKISALETAIGSIDTALTSILTMQDELIGGDISTALDEVLAEQDDLIGGEEA